MPKFNDLLFKRALGEWLFFLGALLALLGYLGYLQHEDFRQIEAQELERLASQAAVIEKNVAPQLLLAHRIINGIRNDLPAWRAENDGFKRANRQLGTINAELIGVQPILVVQADGKVVASSNRDLIGRDFSHREYFQAAIKNPDPHVLHVSAPFKTVLGTYVIALSSVISQPDGAFGGAVIVAVAPEYFSILLDSVRYASDIRSSIAHGDGKLFLTAPKIEEMEGINLASPGSFFTRHRDSGQRANVFTGTVHATGEKRMMALRSIALPSMDKPLVVAVSRNIAAIFAPWKKGLYVQGILLGMIVGLGMLGLWISQRRRRSRFIERKRAEDCMRSVLNEQRLMFDNAHVGIVMLKLRQVIKCNQRQADIFGYANPAQVEGKTMEMFFCSQEQFNEVGDRLYATLATDGFAQTEVEMRRQDGARIWVMMTGRPLDPAAVHDGSIWVYADVTDRRRSETDERIAAIAFESSQDTIITDANGVILRVNQAFTESTGYTSEEVVGHNPRLLRSGRHDADFYRAMWAGINSTGVWQGEVWDQRKNGEVYPKWLIISAVKDHDGAVTHYVGVHLDLSERKAAEAKINELAYFDQLTGLPNRTLLLDRLKQVMAASGGNGHHGALLLIDLDNFKTLNDTLGHDVGDLLLKQAAQRLTTCVREGDTVARLGGDEFVVMLANRSTNRREAVSSVEAVAEEILCALKQIYLFGNATFHGTASIGITLFIGQQAGIDELMKQADLAMYKAKETGRNRFRFFDAQMESAVQERAALESDLRRGLEQKQFSLHYQAQMEGVGRLSGAEALLRWKHPLRGMIPPAEFIPLAEETGLILPLGQWVLETACMKLARWATRPELAHITLAVNVSVQQFRLPDFVNQVLAALNKTGANPQRLKLELTESLLVDNVQDIIEKMNALKSMGVGFALDDFGTGYSSLSYLKRLPLDQLKIDQSFVRDVLTDPNDAAIARTVVALAQSLGLDVIAEGVETEAQRDFLARSNCHAYQGYLFSRPLPISDFEAFAQRQWEQWDEDLPIATVQAAYDLL